MFFGCARRVETIDGEVVFTAASDFNFYLPRQHALPGIFLYIHKFAGETIGIRETA